MSTNFIPCDPHNKLWREMIETSSQKEKQKEKQAHVGMCAQGLETPE